MDKVILWMDKILHHFVGGAGLRPSTVGMARFGVTRVSSHNCALFAWMCWFSLLLSKVSFGFRKFLKV